MTEKEFEQLKVGDKVWVIDGWWEQCVHDGKIRSINEERKTFEIKDNKRTFHNGEVFHSKIEAREALVKHTKDMYAYEVKLCGGWHDSVIKAEKELAKAKEEEEGYDWIIEMGNVRKRHPSDYSCYTHYATEREAYEALAKFYKRKYEEALSKAGKINWVVVGKSTPQIHAVFNAKVENGILVGVDYDGYRFSPVCQNGLFSSRQEAEAELERRKQND